ncbi:hypothetical protein C2E23DRAFT_246371 [Lenzites betulinus]|nr:hypothetical protein C2E23DRAFT_246371 [Lenzites betulinus]
MAYEDLVQDSSVWRVPMREGPRTWRLPAAIAPCNSPPPYGGRENSSSTLNIQAVHGLLQSGNDQGRHTCLLMVSPSRNDRHHYIIFAQFTVAMLRVAKPISDYSVSKLVKTQLISPLTGSCIGLRPVFVTPYRHLRPLRSLCNIVRFQFAAQRSTTPVSTVPSHVVGALRAEFQPLNLQRSGGVESLQCHRRGRMYGRMFVACGFK